MCSWLEASHKIGVIQDFCFFLLTFVFVQFNLVVFLKNKFCEEKENSSPQGFDP